MAKSDTVRTQPTYVYGGLPRPSIEDPEIVTAFEGKEGPLTSLTSEFSPVLRGFIAKRSLANRLRLVCKADIAAFLEPRLETVRLRRAGRATSTSTSRFGNAPAGLSRDWLAASRSPENARRRVVLHPPCQGLASEVVPAVPRDQTLPIARTRPPAVAVRLL